MYLEKKKKLSKRNEAVLRGIRPADSESELRIDISITVLGIKVIFFVQKMMILHQKIRNLNKRI